MSLHTGAKLDGLVRKCMECASARHQARQAADDEAYAPDDPKSPTFHERSADLWDNREKGA